MMVDIQSHMLNFLNYILHWNISLNIDNKKVLRFLINKRNIYVNNYLILFNLLCDLIINNKTKIKDHIHSVLDQEHGKYEKPIVIE